MSYCQPVTTTLRRLLMPVLLTLVLAATVGCDRVTKRIAVQTLAGMPARTLFGGTVTLVYAENAGGFLSLGADLAPTARTVVFVGATGLFLVLVLAAIVRHRGSVWSRLGATLFLAGGASNWIDRFAHGRVVDFLNLGVGSLRTGVFNVADVAILAGVALLVFDEFVRPRSASL